MATRQRPRRSGNFHWGWLAISIFMGAHSGATAQDAAPTKDAKKEAVDEKTIRGLIVQLGDDAFDKRESADKRLGEIGEPALDFLKKAVKDSADPEVRERASSLVLAITRTFFVQVRRFDAPIANGKPWITRVAVTPDGKHVVAAGYGSLRCWDVANGKETMKLDVLNTPYAWSLAFSKDGQRLLAGYDDKVALVFDLKTGKLLGKFEGHSASIWGAALLADGKRAITGSWDKSLRLWEIETGKEIRSFENVQGQVRCLAISPDGKTVAAGHSPDGSTPGSVTLWDIETGKELRTLAQHKLPVTSVNFSPDGSRLLTSGFDAKVSLWDLTGGKELKSMTGHTLRVESAAFSPDGTRIVSGGSQGSPTVCLWDAGTGQQLFQTAEVAGGFTQVAVLPSGNQCVTAGRDGVVRLWQWKR
jgi:WD40 repeat protein